MALLESMSFLHPAARNLQFRGGLRQRAANDGRSHQRGAGLHEGGFCHKVVSDVLPWCSAASAPAAASMQVQHIFQWVKDRAGFEASFRVIFYPAEYNKRMLGVFPIGDPIPYVPEEEVRVSLNLAYSNS
jgi:hypothetical protein